MKIKTKNTIIFILFSITIGLIAGGIIWLFLKILNLSTSFLWEFIPHTFSIPFYTILVCTIGGIIIGLWRKKFGDYPEELDVVMEKVKKDKKYPYNNLHIVGISAILPLIFGGSVGPEAGLTGFIAGICSWISDKFKIAFKELKDLTSIGISATLGVVFNSPMFGFMDQVESDTKDTVLPKTSKILIYFISAFSALGIFYLLNKIFGGASLLPKFEGIQITTKEIYAFIPLIVIGIVSGLLYVIFNKLIKLCIKPINKLIVLKCTLAGLILGVAGYFIPLVMFSGEEQIETLMNSWFLSPAYFLIIIGILKLFITNTCINMGIKGGHFFPIIFAGISFGYGFSILFNINPIFSIVIITAALVALTLRKPLATALLLMICFPIDAFFPILITAVIASAIPIPKFLK